jgi:hypothetical protein
MQKYKNLRGKSKVSEYQINTNSIIIRYKDNTVYLFTNESAGFENIEEMKRLALAGSGLYDFINRHVWNRYAYMY